MILFLLRVSVVLLYILSLSLMLFSFFYFLILSHVYNSFVNVKSFETFWKSQRLVNAQKIVAKTRRKRIDNEFYSLQYTIASMIVFVCTVHLFIVCNCMFYAVKNSFFESLHFFSLRIEWVRIETTRKRKNMFELPF